MSLHYRIETPYNIGDNVYAKQTGAYGNTLFAKRDFKKGELVWLINGPIVKTPTTYTIPISHTLFIDPVPYQNLARNMNHSCEPNCGIRHRVEVVAMRDIKKDEEVAIDYAMIVPEYSTEMTEENSKCLCGKTGCRGKLGSYRELPEEIKKKYEGYISDSVLEWPQENGHYIIAVGGVEPPMPGKLYTSPDLD